MRIKTPKREKVIYLVICVLRFCVVAFLCFWCFWCFQCFWCEQRLFLKSKEFKTALITSFTLLLKIYLITSRNLFSHNLFQLSQSFSIIKVFLIIIFLITIFFNHHNLFQSSQSFFNYHNLFQSSQSFSIFFIRIFFNLFTTCDTIFMKISQRINSII